VAKGVEKLIDELAGNSKKFTAFKTAVKKGGAAGWLSDNGFTSGTRVSGVAAALATLQHAEVKAMKKGRDAATSKGVGTTYKAQMV
jgi:hypothetical protein